MTAVQNSAILAEKPSERIWNDAPRKFDAAAWSGAVCAHQGDLTIVRLDALPASAKPRVNRQMADGNTQGSRHMLVGGSAYDCDPADVAWAIKSLYRLDVNERYIGPVFTGPATLAHPEHGDHVYDCDCVNAVVYQRVLDAEEREQKSQD